MKALRRHVSPRINGDKNVTNINVTKIMSLKIDKIALFVNIYIHNMKTEPLLMPNTLQILQKMGNQIKLARLRRNLSATLVAERARISRATLAKIENGNPSVAIGFYASVLHALGNMESNLLLIAKDDELGRTLQDLGLATGKRARRNR